MSTTIQTTKLTPEHLVAEADGAAKLAGKQGISDEFYPLAHKLACAEITVEEAIGKVKEKYTQ